ncbi:hypothetical protein CUR178_00745 [Leishmania enriettii]|uniref:Leucine-rich repeat protein n=1 Tax=Leishmania enriettii TaxID=5663 RepID=A0A836KHR5_LEIEN|nr:hypothetical protein CUR178_00745 [Leishmania enriettii]
MEYHRLDLVDQGVESLEGLAERKDENFVVINLQRNRLTSFEFFGTHPYLTEVRLQHNRIQSFRGLTKQASLKSLHLQGCPVACHPYYRLMALLTIGFGLEDVDGLPIASHERHVASALGKRAALAVSYGWLLDLHPRTNADYDTIIDELRRLRREEHKRMQSGRLLSVKAVLDNLDRMQRRRGYDAAAELQLAERQQIITRLAGRVAQLERMLTASPPAHVLPLLPPSESTVRVDGNNRASSSSGLLSAAEVALIDKMIFSRGMQLRHNLGTGQGSFERVCLQIDHVALTAESCLSRERLVQLALCSLRVHHVRPLTLVAEDRMGGTVEIRFDSLPLLHTVYKALFFFSARPVPPLSATTQQRALQEMEQVRHIPMNALAPSGVPTASSTVSEVGQSSLWGSASDRPVEDAQRFARTPAATGSKIERGVSSSKVLSTLDNVADIPPLPAACSRPGVAVRSHSNRSFEATQHSRAAVDATSDYPAPEALSMMSHKSADASAAHANDGAPKLVRVDMTGAHSAPQRSQGFANRLLRCVSSDSVAFSRDSKGQGCATEEAVSVAGDGGSAVSPPRVWPPVPSAAAQATDHTEASAPPLVPPRKAQATSASATPSELGRQEESGAGEATLRGSPVLPSVAVAGTHNCPSQRSPVAAGETRRRESAGDVDFQVGAPHGGNISTKKVPSAASVPERPAVSSRFRALLIDSD